MRTPASTTRHLTRLGNAGIALVATAGAALAMTSTASANAAQDVRIIDNPNAKISHSMLFIDGKAEHQLLTRDVVVRSQANWRDLDALVDQFLAEAGSTASVEESLTVGDARRRVLRTESVSDAIELASLAAESGLFEQADVVWHLPPTQIGHDATGRPLEPITLGNARGGAIFNDPGYPNQWHLDNTANPGQDLNVLPVHARGITGAGVNVAIVSQNPSLPQTDHEDLVDNFLVDASSQPVNGFRENPFLTHYAGLISAVGNNATDTVGVAPGSKVGVLNGLTYANQYLAYSEANNLFDIKIHEVRSLLPIDIFNEPISIFYADVEGVFETEDGQNVLSAYVNSVDRGRGGKGVINMYGTGTFNIFWDYLRWAFGNAVAFDQDGVGGFLDVNSDYDAFLLDPMDPTAIGQPLSYYGSRIHFYPPAARRQSLVIAPLDELDVVLPSSTSGTEIIASTYGGVLPGGGGRPLESLTIGDDTDALDADMISDAGIGFAEDIPTISDSATMLAGGVVALMLEANPNLTIRDVQRILQSTAQITPAMNFDAPNALYLLNTDWQLNSAGIAHSDTYGFGKIDADAAVTAAENYVPPERLFVLDSGDIVLASPISIGDAEFEEVDELQFRIDLADEPVDRIQFCLRQDIQIEQVEIELTFSGTGAEDLLIYLTSPHGTSSLLHAPSGASPLGAFVGQPFLNNKFTTYKHWGEGSGGLWELNVEDHGPDAANEVGDEDGPAFTFLGQWGVPGSIVRSEKAIVGYRMRFFGGINNNEIFEGCPPTATTCPGDLNGDGIVTFADLIYFVGWYQSLDVLADLNGDGSVTFADLQIFLTLWRPGFCTPSGLPLDRPSPNSVNDTGPVVRPF